MTIHAPIDPVATRRGDRHQDSRKRVLAAAAVCFIRSGFHGTSMQEICAEANMSPGALYRYYPSKEALIIAIVEEERAQRAAMFDRLTQATSFIGGLLDMADQLLKSEKEMVCVQLGPEITAEAIRNPKLKAMFEAVDDECDVVIRGAFLAAQARGEIDPDLNPDIVLLFIQCMGDGLMLQDKLYPERRLLEQMPALAALLERMLAPPASGKNSGDAQ